MQFLRLLLLLLGTVWTAEAASAPSTRPNILVLLADDLGYADVGFAGGTQIKTPNIDKLASVARGSTNTTSNLFAHPPDAMMTGRYPIRYGLQVGVILPYEKRGLSLTKASSPKTCAPPATKPPSLANGISARTLLNTCPPGAALSINTAITMERSITSNTSAWGGFDGTGTTRSAVRKVIALIWSQKRLSACSATFRQERPSFHTFLFNAVHAPLRRPKNT